MASFTAGNLLSYIYAHLCMNFLPPAPQLRVIDFDSFPSGAVLREDRLITSTSIRSGNFSERAVKAARLINIMIYRIPVFQARMALKMGEGVWDWLEWPAFIQCFWHRVSGARFTFSTCHETR